MFTNKAKRNSVKMLLPYLRGEEYLYVKEITQGLSYDELEDFTQVYDELRRSETVMLILTLVGFGGFAGL